MTLTPPRSSVRDRTLAAVAGLVFCVFAQAAGSAPSASLDLEPAERPCPESVVLNVCADSAQADRLDNNQTEDARKERLRQQFINEQKAQQFRMEYENAHPDQTLVWGKSQGDTDEQGIRRFAATVKDGVRPDCMTAYSYAGLLALPFIVHDLVTDKGCH
jgi:hypothetical protein